MVLLNAIIGTSLKPALLFLPNFMSHKNFSILPLTPPPTSLIECPLEPTLIPHPLNSFFTTHPDYSFLRIFGVNVFLTYAYTTIIKWTAAPHIVSSLATSTPITTIVVMTLSPNESISFTMSASMNILFLSLNPFSLRNPLVSPYPTTPLILHLPILHLRYSIPTIHRPCTLLSTPIMVVPIYTPPLRLSRLITNLIPTPLPSPPLPPLLNHILNLLLSNPLFPNRIPPPHLFLTQNTPLLPVPALPIFDNTPNLIPNTMYPPFTLKPLLLILNHLL
ncbi:unnamed protein product [Lactuca virosa]|uniref:Uncharacterized protein n=1 Tax=Lactuca virosa TaxID=75947 RepID=A0AAU9NW85_9ASTR|nr:unnamed protein product [Lactuca virosa]